MIGLFMDYCHSRQLRPRTLPSYEQALKLFAVWLKESEETRDVERIREGHNRRCIMELHPRGGEDAACIPIPALMLLTIQKRRFVRIRGGDVRLGHKKRAGIASRPKLP